MLLELMAKPWRAELAALLRLAAPLAVLQVAMSAIGVVGLAVVGSSTGALDAGIEQGAAGLGNTLFFVVAVVGMGAVLGFDPLISQALGAGENTRARFFAYQGAWLALFASLALAGLLCALASVLPHTHLDGASAERTRSYLLIRAPSLAPFLITVAARAYLQARLRTRPLLLGALVANLVHVPLAYVLVLGDEGAARVGLNLRALGVDHLTAQGADGAAIAANVALTIMAVVVLVAAWLEGRKAGPAKADEGHAPNPKAIHQGLSIGAPLSLQLLAEVGAFGLVSFLAGTLSARDLAAHHVALTLASLPFQVSMAVAAAASVRVGRTIGEGTDPSAPRRASLTALGVGAGLSIFVAAAFALMPEAIGGLVTQDVDVRDVAAKLIVIAGAFQLVDGAQAIAAGALRGAGDTRVTMWANVGGHYLIGLPLGIGLCFGAGLGAEGLWWGLSAGLAVVSVLLVRRCMNRTERELKRV